MSKMPLTVGWVLTECLYTGDGEDIVTWWLSELPADQPFEEAWNSLRQPEQIAWVASIFIEHRSPTHVRIVQALLEAAAIGRPEPECEKHSALLYDLLKHIELWTLTCSDHVEEAMGPKVHEVSHAMVASEHADDDPVRLATGVACDIAEYAGREEVLPTVAAGAVRGIINFATGDDHGALRSDASARCVTALRKAVPYSALEEAIRDRLDMYDEEDEDEPTPPKPSTRPNPMLN